MNNLKRTLPILMLLLLSLSCEKDNFLLEGRQLNSVSIAPLKYEVFVEELDTSYLLKEELEVMEFSGRNITSIGSITQGEVGALLHLGIGKYISSDVYREEILLSLRFEMGDMDTTMAPGESDLRNYFTLGREFSFGNGGDNVEFGIYLPTGGLYGQRSMSKFLTSPEGTVRVNRIEPYIAPLPEIEGGDQTYLMITFEFSGEVGVHDIDEEFEAEVRRIPYIASKKAWILGEMTLVLAATPA